MRNAVVVQWSRLGDLLQTRILLRTLRRQSYERVILCADASFAEIVRRMPEQPEFWPLDLAQISAAARHSTSHAELIRRLDGILDDCGRIRFAETYVLTRSMAAVLFAELLQPEAMRGYRRRGTDLVPPDQMQWMDSSIRDHHGTPVHLGDLWSSLSHTVFAGEWLESFQSDRIPPASHVHGCKTVGILCDAGESYRSIPSTWLAELVDTLIDKLSVGIELYGRNQPVKSDALTALVGLRAQDVLDYRGNTNLEQFSEYLAGADLVIGSDTGGLHLAAALETPVIGLYFGGAVCLHTGPYMEQSAVIQDPDWTVGCADTVVSLAQYLLNRETSSVNPDNTRVFVPRLDQHGLLYVPYGATALPVAGIKARTEFFKSMNRDQAATDEPTLNLSVIIPEKGGSHYTDAILSDLDAEVKSSKTEIVVVSSDQADAPTAAIAESGSVKRYCHREVLSFAQACNLGAQQAKGKWLLFLNNDCHIEPGFIKSLMSEADDTALVSPLTRYPDGLTQNAGVTFDEAGVHEIAHGRDSVTESVPPDALSAVALLMSADAFRRLNGFDESYQNGYEDLDLCLRARQHGYRLCVAKDVAVTHFRGSTAGRFEHDDANRRLFVERWMHVFDRKVRKPRNTGNATEAFPVVLVSDESAEAAGSRLRWIWPLTNRGFCRDRDFTWLQTSSDECLDDRTLHTLSSAECVVVFRPLQFKENRQAVEETVARSGARLVIDADDLILGRFRSQSTRDQQRSDFEDGYAQLLQRADAITVSTQNLGDHLHEYGFKATVLPTMPCAQMIQNPFIARTRHERRIGFFGTPAHHLDLGAILPALERILDQYDDVYFYWWGCRPGDLAYHPRVRQGGPMVTDYVSHLTRLFRFGLDIAVVPLLDSPAARARSPIKYYEYALARIPSVFSKLTPYSDVVVHGESGLLASEVTGDWVKMISCLLNDAQLRDRIASYAKSDVHARMIAADQKNKVDNIVNMLFPTIRCEKVSASMGVSCPS